MEIATSISTVYQRFSEFQRAYLREINQLDEASLRELGELLDRFASNIEMLRDDAWSRTS